MKTVQLKQIIKEIIRECLINELTGTTIGTKTSSSPFGMNRRDRRDLSKQLAATDTSAHDKLAQAAGDAFLSKNNPSAAYKISSERQRKELLRSLGAKVEEGDEADAMDDMWAGSDDDLKAHGMGDEPQGKSNPLNGQSNDVAAARVNKILSVASKGLFSGQGWDGVRKIEKALNDAGIDFVLSDAKYGGHEQGHGGMPTFKSWLLTINFVNKAGKPFTLVGPVTAHGAGTVENPLSRYDVTAYVAPAKPKAV